LPRVPDVLTLGVMRSDSLDLLRSVCLGTIAFAVQGVPVLRPASHVVDEDDLIVQGNGFPADPDGILVQEAELPLGHPGWAAMITGTVASYVAESADRTWSVVATGMVSPIADQAESARYAERLPGPHDQLIRVYLETVTTYRLATMAV
jgi:hypothetical protein